MEKVKFEKRSPVMQCIYAAVTLIVYIGGVAKDWSNIFSRELTSTVRTVGKPEQAAPAAQLQEAEGAEVAQQAPQPPTKRPAPGLQAQCLRIARCRL